MYKTMSEKDKTEILYKGQPLNDRQKHLWEALKDRGVDPAAKGRFRIISQAVAIDGVKYYPYGKGQDNNKKMIEFPADVVEVDNFTAYGVGVEGETPGDSYLQRVSDRTPLQSRTKIANEENREKKAKAKDKK